MPWSCFSCRVCGNENHRFCPWCGTNVQSQVPGVGSGHAPVSSFASSISDAPQWQPAGTFPMEAGVQHSSASGTAFPSFASSSVVHGSVPPAQQQTGMHPTAGGAQYVTVSGWHYPSQNSYSLSHGGGYPAQRPTVVQPPAGGVQYGTIGGVAYPSNAYGYGAVPSPQGLTGIHPTTGGVQHGGRGLMYPAHPAVLPGQGAVATPQQAVGFQKDVGSSALQPYSAMNPVQGAIVPTQQSTGFQQGAIGTVQQGSPPASSAQGVIVPAQQMPHAQQDIGSSVQQMLTQFAQLNTSGVSQTPLVDNRRPTTTAAPVLVRVEVGQLQVNNNYGTVAPSTAAVQQAPFSGDGFSQQVPSTSAPVPAPFSGSHPGRGFSGPPRQVPPARGQPQRKRREGKKKKHG